MTAPNDLTALAEACERAARSNALLCPDCDGLDPQGDSARYMCSECRARFAEADALFSHARAIREGRVTVNEGGDRERV